MSTISPLFSSPLYSLSSRPAPTLHPHHNNPPQAVSLCHPAPFPWRRRMVAVTGGCPCSCVVVVFWHAFRWQQVKRFRKSRCCSSTLLLSLAVQNRAMLPDTHTHTNTNTNTDRHTQTDKHTHTHTHTHTHMHAHTHSDRQTQTHMLRQNTHTHTHT